MKLSETSLPEYSTHLPENSSRKVVVWTCLVISVAIHLVAIIAVLLASTQRSPGPAVTYIDIDSIADSTSPAVPVIHAPSPQPAQVKPEMPAPMVEKSAESTITEAPAAPAKPQAAEVLATSLGRGMASGYFSSLADGKNLRDEIREYYFTVLEKVNSRWWLRAETLKETASRDGIVEFLVSRDGTLLDLRLLKSTGSREVDRAIIEVLKDTAPFPPLPASYRLDMFQAPLKIAAPLHLFSVRSVR